MTLDRFFSRYAELSLNLPEALASLYAATFIVGGPQGSHAFTNDARFIEWLRQVADFNRQHGMREINAVSIREVPLSPLHTLAILTWGARFEKTGDRVIEFEISYLLERAADEWRILSYISRSDQNAEMASAGLL
jgi:hypothetical protein